jgi:serine phosphatase RsbU (regulator of sigma subunit)
VGTLLYNARSVDPALLVPLSALASQLFTATTTTIKAVSHIARTRKRKVPYLANKGMKVKIITKRIETEVPFLKVKRYHLVIFVDERVTQRLHAELRKKQWPLQRKTQRTEVLSGKRTELKKHNPLLQLFNQLKKRIVLVMMKKRKTLRKVSLYLGKLHKKTRKRRRINANVLIMILVILNKTIQSLLNL